MKLATMFKSTPTAQVEPVRATPAADQLRAYRQRIARQDARLSVLHTQMQGLQPLIDEAASTEARLAELRERRESVAADVLLGRTPATELPNLDREIAATSKAAGAGAHKAATARRAIGRLAGEVKEVTETRKGMEVSLARLQHAAAVELLDSSAGTYRDAQQNYLAAMVATAAAVQIADSLAARAGVSTIGSAVLLRPEIPFFSRSGFPGAVDLRGHRADVEAVAKGLAEELGV